MQSMSSIDLLEIYSGINNPVCLKKSRNSACLSVDEILQCYMSNDQKDLIQKAFLFSKNAHDGQYRRTGEPFIIHPFSVSLTLSKWRLDAHTIAAGLLHDVVEDTAVTLQDIRFHFGPTIANLVDGVSKINKIATQNMESYHAANLRKIIQASINDIRVLLIKLADRLHNMHTLHPMAYHKRRFIAQETLDIYAPIAQHLGLHDLCCQLQNLAFLYLYPLRSAILQNNLQELIAKQKDLTAKFFYLIQNYLKKINIHPHIIIKEKSPYKVYQKMITKKIGFSKATHAISFQILLDTSHTCYITLSWIHRFFKPLPGTYKDYISQPKQNQYQSLHTYVISPDGTTLDIQICTHQMSKIAGCGIINSWTSEHLQPPFAHRPLQSWLRSLLYKTDSKKFMPTIKFNLNHNGITVFTKKGKMRQIPLESTVLDVAYYLHEYDGYRTLCAKVNGVLTALSYTLREADFVEIFLADYACIKKSWLNITKTAWAYNTIQAQMATQAYPDYVLTGKRILNDYLKVFSLSISIISPKTWHELIIQNHKYKSKENILASIGIGTLFFAQIAYQFITLLHKTENKIPIHFSQCCGPIPGDDIVGLACRSKGLVIHRSQCMRLAPSDKDPYSLHMFDVSWKDIMHHEDKYTTSLCLCIYNTPETMIQLAQTLSYHQEYILKIEKNANISDSNVFIFHVTLSVQNSRQLQRVSQHLRCISNLIGLHRLSQTNIISYDNNEKTKESNLYRCTIWTSHPIHPHMAYETSRSLPT